MEFPQLQFDGKPGIYMAVMKVIAAKFPIPYA